MLSNFHCLDTNLSAKVTNRSRMKRVYNFDDLFDECLKQGMEPVVTLSHFEMPYHLVTKYGVWRNRKLIDFLSASHQRSSRAIKKSSTG